MPQTCARANQTVRTGPGRASSPGRAVFQTENVAEQCIFAQFLRRADSLTADKQRPQKRMRHVLHRILRPWLSRRQMLVDDPSQAQSTQALLGQDSAAVRGGVEIIVKLSLDGTGAFGVTLSLHRESFLCSLNPC